MACNSNVVVIYSPSIIQQGFFINGAVKVTAYGLIGNDVVTFNRVRYCSDNPNYHRGNCTIFAPEPAHISTAIKYQIGACVPSLYRQRNSIFIQDEGFFIPVVENKNSADLVIEIEPAKDRWFSDKEKGIDPCCPYNATVPLQIDMGCGDLFWGYIYHPNDIRDPTATVEIKDCDGRLYGYAYPSAGDGHTLAIEECGDDGIKVVGYCVNRSNTAPIPLNTSTNTKHDDCNCNGGNTPEIKDFF